MTKLKLSGLPDDAPVKLTVEVPADIHAELALYAEMIGAETGRDITPAKLIAPMLARFMASDRGFAKAKRQRSSAAPG